MIIRTDIPRKASGIYIIQSIHNNKQYVGSAINLKNRKGTHFTELKRNSHGNLYLQNHYNKYGKPDLWFGIIEFVRRLPNEYDDDFKIRLLATEQYYIDTLKPEFNICKIAGSAMLGRTHSKETCLLLKQLRIQMWANPEFREKHKAKPKKVKIKKGYNPWNKNNKKETDIRLQNVGIKISKGLKKWHQEHPNPYKPRVRFFKYSRIKPPKPIKQQTTSKKYPILNSLKYL